MDIEDPWEIISSSLSFICTSLSLCPTLGFENEEFTSAE